MNYHCDDVYIYNSLHPKVIVSSTKSIFVDPDKLSWNYEQQCGDYLTLREVSDQLLEMGYSGVFYVWVELGVSGTIYQYGNYPKYGWCEHGRTKGFA